MLLAKGGLVNISGPGSLVVVIVLLLILFFIFKFDINLQKKNIKIANTVQKTGTEYVLPKNGIQIFYNKYSTGEKTKNPFLVPAESDAKEDEGIILIILPNGAKLPDELEYSHGAGATKDGRVRMILKK